MLNNLEKGVHNNFFFCYNITVNKREVNCMFYKILVSNERSTSDVYIASTKEECEKHIMEFADFWCSNGTCTIYEIDNRFKTHRYWKYESGKCVKESSREADIEEMRKNSAKLFGGNYGGF